MTSRLDGTEEMPQSQDLAESLAFAVTPPRHVAVDQVMARPTERER
ncbi:MAG: hypothetical protein ACLPR9_07965 [Acidimicrobiales bacterium]|jgi:NADP-dependent 3-hydroxy acid dehydrogenase YdfG